VIGDRPIDLHLRGFEALGAAVRVHGGNVKVFAPSLHGATISLKGKFGTTVLGTDNVVMAAVLADGTTIIEDAAREPEVVDLANFLNKMGANIQGAGSSRIVIEGVKELHGAEHEVIPDRIEAGTFLIAGAIAGREVTVNRVKSDHLNAVTDALVACGFRVGGNNGSLTIHANGSLKPLDLRTQPYPGFPTDMQAQMCALLSTAAGESSVTESIFPQRFMHVSELKRMGAAIDLDGATANIRGVDNLSGAPVMASDLRASAALILAGLLADGTTEISRVYHIDRGYEMIDEKLEELGARIERVKV
jgi:UDP-N-acetylglucosamine 1-carboxyvinyltransferase